MSETCNYICEELTKLQMRALNWLDNMSSMDTEAIDVMELGAVTDVVKDLFQAEKYLMETCYYKSKIEDLDEPEAEAEAETVTKTIHQA